MLKPLNNRILLRPDEIEEKTQSGIILAKKELEKPTTGEVLIGNTEIKKGQRVLFSKFGYDEVVVDEQTLYIISEQNILGVFTK